MVREVPDILARIVEHKRSELVRDSARLDDLKERAGSRTDRRDFRRALEVRAPAIIGEIKRASPSKGLLERGEFDPATIARQYSFGGAAALSVLTDREFFQGSLSDLEVARAAVSLPVLRKDFTIDPFHVVEAAAHGADAILLIAALLDEEELRDLRELAATYRMAALVEVHDFAELEVALGSGAEIIGVNNRNLRTFQVSHHTSEELAREIPANVLKISESGIHRRSDVEHLQELGYQAFLVGEYLMSSKDRTAAVKELLS